ncbi:Magnesium-protoporphyrin O-methyltransferase [Posidoniimonas corsicana]|uniref:Magnesium-protoporphyrin O-methyltransferase n=1 Tax=Posidoniimonas corsicana TaxID=1938618 RepID=A0A5C5V1B6_9BACT|nr:class I SAM-dependent methyltransferase [Posidoniimonas corsicana]TWT32404.1 Magnesium-protoporphyrin O-methyltransferase [Posidoniimonas corsicana]
MHAAVLRTLALASVVLWLATPARAADEYLGRTIARTMHFTGAPWLVRDSREREEEPKKLLAALGLKPGMQVCDLGCGNGFYALKLAERIQPGGVVWAVDIQPEMLDLLRERAAARQVKSIKPVLGEGADPKLPAGEIDLLLLVDVYHEIAEPAAMLQKIHESLAPRGRAALVEFRAEDPAVPIKPLHKMTQRQCVKEFTANGFKLVGQYDELPWQHVLFFARDDSPLKESKLKAWAADR